MTKSLFADEAQPELATQVLVVGAGPVGLTFERALSHVGFPVRHWSRSLGPLWPQGSDPAPADVVILAVRDDAIAQAAQYLVAHGAAGPQSVVLHCAGGRPPSQVLGTIRPQVKGIGLLHPLRSFVHRDSSEEQDGSGPQKEHELVGTVMALCGDSDGLSAGQTLCQALSGVPLVLTEDRLPMYHAAAVLAAGHVATLIDVAVQLLGRIGLDRKVGAAALTTLTESVLHNIRQIGLPQALTGPIARGDALTVASHLDALNRQSCQVGDIYRVVAESSLDIAYRKGAADDAALAAVGDVLASRRS